MIESINGRNCPKTSSINSEMFYESINDGTQLLTNLLGIMFLKALTNLMPYTIPEAVQRAVG